MNNNNFDNAAEILRKYNSWQIFTHRKSDGDALGSACALITAGKNSGKSVNWFSPDEKPPRVYSFLPNIEQFTAHENIFAFDNPEVLYVFLDCSNENRSVQGFPTNPQSRAKISVLNIDHHEDNTLFGNINCVDGKSSSTCEMLFNVLESGNFDINQQIAEALFTGIYTDTGGFSFSCTSAKTHKIAAELINCGVDSGIITDKINQHKSLGGFLLWSRAMSRVKIFGDDDVFALSWLTLEDFQESGASSSETEGLSNMLMSLRGVKLIALLSQTQPGIIRVSFRSRPGINFGAGEVARNFGGGGHEQAAGVSVETSDAIPDFANRIEKFLIARQKFERQKCTA